MPRGLARLRSLLALLPFLGCADASEQAGGIDRETFVAAYVDLRSAVVRDSLQPPVRDSILARHGVTTADLQTYIDRQSANPDALSDTWREILDSIAARDSAAMRALKNDSLIKP